VISRSINDARIGTVFNLTCTILVIYLIISSLRSFRKNNNENPNVVKKRLIMVVSLLVVGTATAIILLYLNLK